VIYAAIRPGVLTVAIALAVFVVMRWRRLGVENKILGAVAAVALGIYGIGVIHPPNLEELLRDTGEALGPYTYILVGVMAFLETGAFVGLIAPGETVVVVGGLVAGQGQIDILVLIGLVWAAAVAGDTVSFLLGRRLGRDFLLKHGPRVRITPERLAQVEGFLQKHGGPTILFGRFLGLVRALAPFIAGASRLPFGRFFPYDVIAAGAWATTFSLLGYIFWRSFDRVVDIAKKGAFAFGATVAVIVGAVIAYRYLRVPENRHHAKAWIEEQSERPLLRPLARVARPVYRRVLLPVWRTVAPWLQFLWERITPGQLGLELTSLLAVSAVGSYVFFALASLVESRDQLGSDTRAFDISAKLEMGWLDDVVEAFTDLGALTVTSTAVAAVVVFLLIRRRWIEGIALAAGMGLTVAAVHITKGAVDRPRASDSLVDTMGSSFPSGHAAYSIAYVAISVAVAHAFEGATRRATFFAGTIVLAALIGLSRVYLRAHYLSDVLAGWGLGAAIFATCGIVGLIVAFVRQTRRRGS
jgi:membrane protein DedA with SNARE-associated domain